MARRVDVRVLGALVLCLGLVPGCAPVEHAPVVEPVGRGAPRSLGLVELDLAGAVVLPHGAAYAALDGDRVGGLSGLAFDPSTGFWMGVVDDRRRPRLVAFSIVGEGASFAVEPQGALALDLGGQPGAPPMLDGEGLVRWPGGGWLVASEGDGGASPRVPPGLYRFDATGRYVGALPVPGHYLPEPAGPQGRGVRNNAAFESLTLSPDGEALFTAAEGPLVQDDERSDFERGSHTRLLEYVPGEGGFAPAREFVYPLDALPSDGLDFAPDQGENGLVELVALADGRLLALERAFVREAAAGGRSANRIRLYVVTLDGATDVARLPSLRGATYRPVTKTLVLDLGPLAPRLPPELARLDNFEALAFGPPLADGRATLVLASDDNFSPRQRTAFVLLADR
jgi:hypothetical protein